MCLKHVINAKTAVKNCNIYVSSEIVCPVSVISLVTMVIAVAVCCRFRHAVVRTLTGKGHSAHKRTMADVVDASMKIERKRKEGKKPEGDTSF